MDDYRHITDDGRVLFHSGLLMCFFVILFNIVLTKLPTVVGINFNFGP